MDKAQFCLTPKEIEKILIEHKIQVTAQRIAISQYVLCEGNHPTAEEVKVWADKNCPKVSLATVYNTLGILVKVGLLIERRFSNFDKVVYDCNINPHFHFLDQESNQLEDIDPSLVEVDFKKLKGKYKVKDVEVLLIGGK